MSDGLPRIWQSLLAGTVAACGLAGDTTDTRIVANIDIPPTIIDDEDHGRQPMSDDRSSQQRGISRRSLIAGSAAAGPTCTYRPAALTRRRHIDFQRTSSGACRR